MSGLESKWWMVLLLCTTVACGEAVSPDDGGGTDGIPENCGDGVIDEGEACDDGGESSTCDIDCTLASCGDGSLNITAGEFCDDAGESANCNVDCTLPLCGDGLVNASSGEACDDEGPSAVCDDDCTLPECGDGVFNPIAGEICDDGGDSTNCDADCTLAECGDGRTNPVAGEACDDAGESETCDADCSAVVCGDDTLNTLAGEDCEDGNALGGDGCSAICTQPVQRLPQTAEVTLTQRFSASFQIAIPGDVNGDGFADLLIGDPGNSEVDSSAGAAFLVFGSASMPGEIDLADADVKMLGEERSDRAGDRVSGAGDVNGDGFADLLIGEQGSSSDGGAYLVYGGPSLPATLDLVDADVQFLNEAADDRLGSNVAAAGDLNADGFDDLVIGARSHDEGGSNAGAVYVVFGGNSLSGTLGIVNANLKIIGEAASDGLSPVAGLGDVNGDGIDDLLIGASGNDEGGSGAGAAYVVFGDPNLSGTLDVADADIKLVGQAASDFAGSAVAAAGDVNGDGFADILVGASGTDQGDDSSTGTAYLLYGSATLSGTINFFQGDTKLLGEFAGDRAGGAVTGAGDVNGDGFADILIGATGNLGTGYLVHGPVATGTLELADADIRIPGGEDGRTAQVAGGGDVDGDGLDDIMMVLTNREVRLFLTR
ncbi:MAG: hypothetical protein AAGA48_14240 [Myxococcota bacterium]